MPSAPWGLPQPGLVQSEKAAPGQPHQKSPQKSVDQLNPPGVDPPGIGGVGVFPHGPQFQAPAGAVDEGPSGRDEHQTGIGDEILLEEHRTQPRNILEEGQGGQTHLRPLKSRIGIAEKVGQIAAHESQNESHRHLGLSQVDAGTATTAATRTPTPPAAKKPRTRLWVS